MANKASTALSQTDTQQLLRELQRRSVQAPGTGAFPIQFIQVAHAADEAPAWWSPARDAYLRKFFPTEPYLCGALYSVIARNAAYKLEFRGNDNTAIERAKQLLYTTDFFRGWYSFAMKLSLDLLSQDNFAFGEIVRPARVKILGGLTGAFERYNGGTFRASRAPVRTKSGEVVPSWHALIPYPKGWYSLEGIEYEVKDSEFDLPIGLNHLDAARCTRTGDPETPVIYTDTEGTPHPLKWYQVFTLEDMPCSDETRYGVGYCAVSRCLRLAQTLRDIQIYKQEKVTGQFAGSVWLTNVPDQFITDAIKRSKETAKAENLLRYMTPVIAYTMEPNAQPYAFEIKLASLPDGFNEEEALRWYIAGVALAFAVDYGFLAPLPGGKLGTSEQAEVAERQSRGKASRLFMSQMELILNYRGILQEGVWAEYKEVDVEEELARDTACERRAKTRATMIESGEITAEMARKMAVEAGDYSDDYLEMAPEPEEEEEDEGDGGDGKADRRWWNVGFGRKPADEAMEPQEKSLGDVLTGILSKVPGVKKKTPVISARI